MSSILLASASNVQAFQALLNLLDSADVEIWGISISRDAVEDEQGRFRVWCGNIGALSKGHSSLEYRLRDSPLLSSNTLQFLGELEENLKEAIAIVSGARLPYEQQPKSDSADEEDEDDDGFFSEDEDDGNDSDDPENSKGPKTELSMRFGEIVDIIDNLYKLSVRIRTPTIRARSLKASSYQPKEADTGADIMAAYAEYDARHIKELLAHLRHSSPTDNQDGDDFLIGRLSAAITLRRRQFKYWKRHREKLGNSVILEEITTPIQPVIHRPEGPQRNDTLEVHLDVPLVAPVARTLSNKTSKTLLSGTEATLHHQSLDEIIDAKSVTSYAVTVKDIHGKGVDLPPPPKAANGEKDFECPYCYVICPARYGRGRAWRTHVLLDLQAYVCTYDDCESSEQLFSKRREWVEHEASHRKAWRCPEHATAVYRSRGGLEDHLRSHHMDSIPASQISTIVNIGETTTLDMRRRCPICHASSDDDSVGDFQNHIANHLERIATFSLPSAVESDDGGSSVASRGWSGSSQDLSDMSLRSEISEDAEEHENRTQDPSEDTLPVDLEVEEGSSRALLSAESLQHLPDTSQNRLEMTAAQVELQNNTTDLQSLEEERVNSQDDELADDTPRNIQEHMELRESFRTYILSLPGTESVRFYRRYGSWTGQATFKSETAAAEAVTAFDVERFPFVKLQQISSSMNKVKFSTSNLVSKKELAMGSDPHIHDDIQSNSSESVHYEEEQETEYRGLVLSIQEIPNLRSLYRTRRLLQRDQSFNSNDTFNRVISFCYHDLTRLKVDAIVNSSGTSLKPTSTQSTLNYTIYKAAGPGLTKEAKSKPKIKAGQVELTHGHKLPCSWIIHASRPNYSGSNGMGKFNILTECYRSALKMAVNYEFKTIAFPCLGAGGCGFPPRVAARIALQEVREYLDSLTDYNFERIIFCVNSAVNEKAYMDFIPVFFPPTHGDLDVARSTTEFSANRSALASQVLESRTQVQLAHKALLDFTLHVKDFDKSILNELIAIDSALAAVRGFLLGPKEIKRSLGDLNMFSSVIQTLCGSITELAEQAQSPSESDHQSIWADFNTHMRSTHGTDLASLLADCENFIQGLADVVIGDGVELDEMSIFRRRLEIYRTKHEGETPKRDFHDHLEEILYTREFHLEETLYTREFQGEERSSHSREVVKLYQIPSVSRLYQLGELEAKPTLAHPSAIFNHTVCLIREDVTKMEVDIIVNSTDRDFSGMGTLDRTVFKKGGAELQEQIKRFAKSKDGDVIHTPGYKLPAKHLLHVVPPGIYRNGTKDVLRKIYREILHTAVILRATSIAIPSVGTGMLNYPRRDCAALALEEVKRFLESAEPASLLEKIIFVTFSFNDTSVYKSIFPIYFPPVSSQPDSNEPVKNFTTPSESQPRELMGNSITPEPSPNRRRTLFGSIGEAFQRVRFGQKEVSRQITTYEEHALIDFDLHAKDCTTCKDINRLYAEGQDLKCEIGYPLAQVVLWYMDMTQDQTIYSKPDSSGQRARLEVPADLFPMSITLLSLVEQSFRDESRTRPFVSQNRPHLDVAQDQASQEHTVVAKDAADATLSESFQISAGREKPRAEVAVHSSQKERWDPIFHGECSIHVHPGRIDVHDDDYPAIDKIPLLSLELTPLAELTRHATNKEIVLSNAKRLDSVLSSSGDVLFRSRTAVGSEALLDMMKRAKIDDAGKIERLDSIESQDPISESTTELSYPEWNRRLHGIRSEMTSAERSQRRLSVPQGEKEDNENLSPLAAEIYAHLVEDLRSRPGSYIGKHINDIASAIQKPIAETSTAMVELAALKKIHNTIDHSTWVISHVPSTIPSLGQEQKPSSSPIASTAGEAEQSIHILAEQVLSYMTIGSLTPEHKSGHTIREISAAMQRPSGEIWPAIRHLDARGEIKRTLDVETWVVSTARQKSSSVSQIVAKENEASRAKRQEPDTAAAEVRETPIFQDTPPSPSEQSKPGSPNTPRSAGFKLNSSNDLSTVPADDFLSNPASSKVRWTRVAKRIVDASVLTEFGETFDEKEDSFIVHRVLRRGEIERWTERTQEIREERRRNSDKDRYQPRRLSNRRGSEDRVRGRREDEGKDTEQELLERVLAGDMKEDSKHFADEDEERKVDQIR